MNHIPGFEHALWPSIAYDCGIAGVSRQIQQAADDALIALDREKEARIYLHWKGIKQLPRLLQLLAHTYTWGERWLEANPPFVTDDRQDWVRVKQSTSHDLNILLYEYLSPTRYKSIFDELGSSSRSPKLGTHVRNWFRHIAVNCNTAAPISLDETERHLLVKFLEMTMDKMRNPRTTGDIEICLIVPRAYSFSLASVDQANAIDPYHIAQYMYQLFKTFRKDFRIKFHLLTILETSTREQLWTWPIGAYIPYLDPGFELMEKVDADDFQINFGGITREDIETMGFA
jgi:hypothetical protein